MRKDTTIISDLRTFFTKNDADHAIYSLMEVMERIHIQPKQIGMAKKANCKFTPLQVLNLLIVFPFFTVKNAYRYSGSSLNKLFRCEKDMFYRFVNNGNIKWRKLLYVLNMQLLQKISKETTSPSGQPTMDKEINNVLMATSGAYIYDNYLGTTKKSTSTTDKGRF